MWNEIRADRTLVETMAEIPPRRAGRSCGTDLQEPEHARSLGTAIRYMTAAGMATQRAQRAFFQHRKAKQAGLILPATEAAEVPANQNCTNEITPEPERLVTLPTRPSPIREIARTISRGPWSGLCPSGWGSCAPRSPARSVAPWPKQTGCRPRQRR